jgi:hypothetical protein
MIFCFVVDTNPSMKQHLSESMSSLDICKCVIEHFLMKLRAISPQSLDKSLMLFQSGFDEHLS